MGSDGTAASPEPRKGRMNGLAMGDPAAFERRLRRGKIAPPTARNFDPEPWQQVLEQAESEQTRELARAGLWFHAALQARWASLEALDLANAPAGVLSRHAAGIANFMQLRTDAMIALESQQLDAASLPTGSMAHVKLGIGEGAATADMIRTSGIDTIGKLAGYVRSTVTRGRGNARLDKAALSQALPLFEDIYLLEYLWGRVAWCGWRMIPDGTHLRFDPPSPDPLGESFVVAEYRRELLFAEFGAVYAMEWRADRSALPPAWQVRARKRDDRFDFEVLPAMAGTGDLPAGYVLRELLKGTELAPYLDEPLQLPGDPAISLNDLVSAWELLALAAEALRSQILGKRPVGNDLAYAPSVRLTDLETLLVPLGWDAPKRKAAIGFFVYEGEAIDGLWSRPLLPIGGGRVVPVLTPLICPNMMRTAELWVTQGAGETLFTRRGNEAETRLRRDIAAALRDRPWRASASVLQEPWEPKIDRVPRDIDLVIRIGSAAFIGELKLKKYPVSAAEVGRHAEEFEHAAGQLDIRLAWLARNKALLAAKTGFGGDPESLTLHGFIISGTAFGSGTRAGGYPVIDRDALTFFFENDAFLIAAGADRADGYVGRALRPSLGLPLVEHDAAVSLLAYLGDPLHIRYAEAGLVAGTRLSHLKASGETLEWAEPFVDGALIGPLHADALAETLGARWRAQQDQAAALLAVSAPLRDADSG